MKSETSVIVSHPNQTKTRIYDCKVIDQLKGFVFLFDRESWSIMICDEKGNNLTTLSSPIWGKFHGCNVLALDYNEQEARVNVKFVGDNGNLCKLELGQINFK